jgi:uncharacterized protein YraI
MATIETTPTITVCMLCGYSSIPVSHGILFPLFSASIDSTYTPWHNRITSIIERNVAWLARSVVFVPAGGSRSIGLRERRTARPVADRPARSDRRTTTSLPVPMRTPNPASGRSPPDRKPVPGVGQCCRGSNGHRVREEGANEVQTSPATTRAGIARIPHVLVALILIASTLAATLSVAPQTGSAAEARALAAINLRSGPGWQYRIIQTIPAGASIKVTGSYNKGFYPVRYKGTKGWVDASYVSTYGGKISPLGPVKTTESLNLRSGPGTGYSVKRIMPAGASLKITGSYNNGYYPVRYQGTKGWAAAGYLAPVSVGPYPSIRGIPKGPAKTTDSVNLRSGPSTGYSVRLVMPAGASLTVTGSYKNGFYPVRYQGQKGWASADYLAPARPLPTWTEEEIIAIIYAAAREFGLDGAEMVRIARCESNLDPYNVTPPYAATGLFQFLPSTWASTPYAHDNIFDPALNAQAAAWMWTHGRRNEWECG